MIKSAFYWLFSNVRKHVLWFERSGKYFTVHIVPTPVPAFGLL